MPTPFIFLDRDGTIIEEKNYLSNPDEIVIIPSVIKGLKELRGLGFSFAFISNQSGIGRGYFNLEDLYAVNSRLEKMLSEEGILIEKFYFCPHTPEEKCVCRKPSPKMVFDAKDELNADLNRSFMIGDKACDIELAFNAGIVPILIRTGYGIKEELKIKSKYPEIIVASDFIDVACKVKQLMKVN